MNYDLKLACDHLERDKLRFVAIKNKKVIYSSREGSVRGLIAALHEIPRQMEGSFIADRIVGSAAALLFMYGKISGLHTPVISTRAKSMLEKDGINIHFIREVDYIKNRAGDDMCPLEFRCQDISDPESAYSILSSIIKGGAKP
ncbi:MAG: DUF1893 domain-containing protein [Candidatus Eremiobacteraeota bacterium]|nr:DUF1893 domain-containing protein [Candidatus Eremiobacteraeota bacterium]